MRLVFETLKNHLKAINRSFCPLLWSNLYTFNLWINCHIIDNLLPVYCTVQHKIPFRQLNGDDTLIKQYY